MSWGFLEDASDMFSQATDTWLKYEAIKQGADYGGVSQPALNKTPEVTHQVQNDAAATAVPQSVPLVMGVPVTYVAFGALALVGVVLIAKN